MTEQRFAVIQYRSPSGAIDHDVVCAADLGGPLVGHGSVVAIVTEHRQGGLMADHHCDLALLAPERQP